ncbi:50S ribosomal protein L23 [Candidatus Woesebacteria bacterium RIFCSPHIGHO2_01_FULL_38_9]|uniref:Large ribosomal subunit protein uL23 n=2 Tax=Candidatus Woeseibacteriota TaxID=1752722 RepID=A0A1F7Y3U6_9BACT|nr:MAG: 50S ribosomal protein L23 [Candidatus Woesebacteria bacterium RIFCSPHIGHO2_01_FULL_38_9]OGM58624.1 MAG: 50S ribosomal protein L23 [Candidatus Woesebacteria bacterium RIFCSPLOWO2_01_FULL_39_10]
MIEPIITEKTLKLAESGKYTFRVDPGLNKFQVKKYIENIFGVHVTKVRTVKKGGEEKRTRTGRSRVVPSSKKAIVSLKEKETINLFESKKK